MKRNPGASTVFVFALLSLWVLIAAALPLCGQSPPSLFTSLPAAQQRTASVGSSQDPVEVLRSAPLALSPESESALSQGAASMEATLRGVRQESISDVYLTLNLFPDTVPVLRMLSAERTHDGMGTVYRGAIGENAEGHATFTLYRGAFSGFVRLGPRESYEIFIPQGSAGEVRQVRFRGYPEGASDIAVAGASFTRSAADSAGFAAIAEPKIETGRLAGGTSFVDLLVAYSANARAARSGAAGMLAHINQVVAESNDAFAASGVDLRLRLAHAVEVGFDDSASSMSYGSALGALRQTSDGKVDEVHALRNQFGADIVSLWVSPPLPGSGTFTVGQAYLLDSNPDSFASYAFSVVHQRYAGGSSAAFPHEVGHNLGLSHDEANGGQNGGIFSYARGYQQKTLDPKFFTIMAYSTGCSGCQALVQFSNPAVAFQTVPTGIPGNADAARALVYVAPFATAWRSGAPTPCDYAVSPSSFSVSSGGASLNVNVVTTAGCTWSATTNSGWIAIGGAAMQSGSGSVTLQVAANASPASRNGTATVAGRAVSVAQAGLPALPTLSVSPSQLLLSAAAGQTSVVEGSFSVQAGSAALSASANVSLPSWLSVVPTQIQTPGILTVRANPSGLTPGAYSATITVSAPGSVNGSVPVNVIFNVQSRTELLVSAKALSFRAEPNAAPAAQVLRVRTPSAQPLVDAAASEWFSADVTFSGDTWSVAVTASAAGLNAGVYDGTVTLSCESNGCEPVGIPVRLVVDASSSVSAQASSLARIGSGGIVNAASFEPGIAVGAWNSIFGSNLANTARTWRANEFVGLRMPTSLDGVEVRVDGERAAIHYISAGQVNFQAPAGLPNGWVLVELMTPNGNDSAYVHATREAPGFFQFDAAGNVAALHPDATPVGAMGPGAAYVGRPAVPGEVLAVYGTGFGPTATDVPPGFIYTGATTLLSAQNVTVTIGGVEATVEYAGLTGAGLNQINVRVPNLPPGTHEIVATVEGSPTQFRGKVIVD